MEIFTPKKPTGHHEIPELRNEPQTPILFTTKNLRIELPSLHTGLFIVGAELLSPHNEQSRLGIETSDTLGSL
jgi:hypothetical protein